MFTLIQISTVDERELRCCSQHAFSFPATHSTKLNGPLSTGSKDILTLTAAEWFMFTDVCVLSGQRVFFFLPSLSKERTKNYAEQNVNKLLRDIGTHVKVQNKQDAHIDRPGEGHSHSLLVPTDVHTADHLLTFGCRTKTSKSLFLLLALNKGVSKHLQQFHKPLPNNQR